MNEQQVRELFNMHIAEGFELSFKEFEEWMVGQTIRLDSNGNTLYYPHDVERYIEQEIEGKVTYFD